MRLIDADALKADFDQEIDYDHFGITYVINEQPTIELPIKRGEWIFRCVAGEDPYECNVCGNSVNVHGYPFCPNCGAYMTEETNTDRMETCDRCGVSFNPTNSLCICEKCDAELEV